MCNYSNPYYLVNDKLESKYDLTLGQMLAISCTGFLIAPFFHHVFRLG